MPAISGLHASAELVQVAKEILAVTLPVGRRVDGMVPLPATWRQAF